MESYNHEAHKGCCLRMLKEKLCYHRKLYCEQKSISVLYNYSWKFIETCFCFQRCLFLIIQINKTGQNTKKYMKYNTKSQTKEIIVKENHSQFLQNHNEKFLVNILVSCYFSIFCFIYCNLNKKFMKIIFLFIYYIQSRNTYQLPKKNMVTTVNKLSVCCSGINMIQKEQLWIWQTLHPFPMNGQLKIKYYLNKPFNFMAKVFIVYVKW